MSTILDALRKLQRERERAHPPRDLQESVTQQLSATRPARRVSARLMAVGWVALLCLSGGGALIWKWPALRGAAPEASPHAAYAGSGSEPAASPPVAQPRARRRRPPHAAARQGRTPTPDAAALPRSPVTPAADLTRRPEPQGRSLALQPVVEPVAATPRLAAEKPPPPDVPAVVKLKPVSKPKPAGAAPVKKSRVSGRRQRDRRERSKPADSAPASAPKKPPVASTVAQRSTRASVKPKPPPKTTLKTVSPPPPVAEAERRSKREPSQQESNPFLELFVPVTRVERAPSETLESERGAPPILYTEFPELALESVRWHPDPSRRVANVVVDQARGVTVREGDIVRGVLIHRIDPGAVELRVGTAKKLLQMGP